MDVTVEIVLEKFCNWAVLFHGMQKLNAYIWQLNKNFGHLEIDLILLKHKQQDFMN